MQQNNILQRELPMAQYDIPKVAMIFAAGFGKRMRPLTNEIPKAMVEVCGKPMIDYRIDKLVEVGVEKIVINTHYLPEVLENYLHQRSDIEIEFSREDEILETGGGLIRALGKIGNEPFFIVNCDTIWLDSPDFDSALLRLAKNWRNDMNSLLLLHPIEKAVGYDGDGDFNFVSCDEVDVAQVTWKNPQYVYTGIQIFNPKLLNNIKEHPFSIAEFWKKYDGVIYGTYGIVHKGDWLHVDSVANLQKAEEFLCKISV